MMADKDSYKSGSSVPVDFFLQFSIKVNYFFDRKIICPTFALAKNGTDSVAQLVEHIPFKDGVLGSNPSWITKQPLGCFSFFRVFEPACPAICLLR